MAALEARFEVTVGVGPATFTVHVELSLERGILVVIGPSGAGKSLTLQTLAGLLRPVRGFVSVGGTVLFDDEHKVDVPVSKRRVGYVPQHQSLFPFLNVADNVAFGAARREPSPRASLVAALLDELGIAHRARSFPAELSGGERQRVALARALAASPRLLLLDEPFAALDQDGRRELRAVLRDTVNRRALPVVFVTHDRDEAMELADSIVRFERGRTAASGTPEFVLGRASPVTVSGQATDVQEVDAHRARVTIVNATIEGPIDLFPSKAPGPVELVLLAPPEKPRPSGSS